MNPLSEEPSITFLNRQNTANLEFGVPFDIKFGPPVYNPEPAHIGLQENINMYFEIYQKAYLYPDKSQVYDLLHDIPGAANEMIEQKIFSPQKWKQLLIGDEATVSPGQFGVLFEHVNYDYSAFMTSLPYSKEQANNSLLPRQSYINIEPEYNYNIKSYEALSANPKISERLLPNMYSLQTVSNSEAADIGKVNPSMSSHVSLNGKMKVVTTFSSGNQKVLNPDTMNYFNQYSREMQKIVIDEEALSSMGAISDKYKNIIIPSSEVAKLKDMADKKEMFPIFATIDISTEKVSHVADILREVDLLDKFTLEVVKSVISGETLEKRFHEVNELLHVAKSPTGETLTKKMSHESIRDNRVWDVTKLLESVSLIDFDTGVPAVAETLGQHLEACKELLVMDPTGAIEKIEASPPENKFYNNLMSLIAVQKLKEFFKSRIRTYDDLMAGKLNYSETMLYRIEKIPSSGAVEDGPRIQNIWMANISEQDIVTYVDTQLKYGQEYMYKIYAYQMVLESKYSYSDIHVNGSNTKSGYNENMPAEFTTTIQPTVLLVEQELYRHIVTVLDSPPPPPQVNIVPYRDDPGHVLVTLSPSVDDYMDFPIIIEDADVEQFDEIRKAQKKPSPEKIRFNADDTTGAGGYFEVYRTSQPPRSYEDFKRSLMSRAANNILFGSDIEASSVSIKLPIRANTKHYLTFRMVDSHFHVSNPTVVYEIEIVEHNGAHYFTKRVVDMAPREPRLPSKPCRRLIEIKPALDQQFIDFSTLEEADSAFDVKSVKLGNPVSPWDRRFKIRFVSRKTGKKIDLNLRCKTKVEKGNPNNE